MIRQSLQFVVLILISYDTQKNYLQCNQTTFSTIIHRVFDCYTFQSSRLSHFSHICAAMNYTDIHNPNDGWTFLSYTRCKNFKKVQFTLICLCFSTDKNVFSDIKSFATLNVQHRQIFVGNCLRNIEDNICRIHFFALTNNGSTSEVLWVSLLLKTAFRLFPFNTTE